MCPPAPHCGGDLPSPPRAAPAVNRRFLVVSGSGGWGSLFLRRAGAGSWPGHGGTGAGLGTPPRAATSAQTDFVTLGRMGPFRLPGWVPLALPRAAVRAAQGSGGQRVPMSPSGCWDWSHQGLGWGRQWFPCPSPIRGAGRVCSGARSCQVAGLSQPGGHNVQQSGAEWAPGHRDLAGSWEEVAQWLWSPSCPVAFFFLPPHCSSGLGGDLGLGWCGRPQPLSSSPSCWPGAAGVET